LANVSHELRTPLNAILGFSQLMLQDSTLTAKQHGNLATIGRSGEHLLALINDVLELSKIEAGRIELHEADFDLHRMLLGLEEMLGPRAESKGLALLIDAAPDVPQCVHADESRLREVLINLMSNAIKFTESGSVTLRLTLQPIPSRITFGVSDTGLGIAADEMDAAFEPFTQTSSGRLSGDGTGLGLPISRQYVQIMGGELTASSEPGRGSTFQFDVPVQVVDPSQAQITRLERRVIGMEPGQHDGNGAPYRMLIVEDEEANRDLLAQVLERLSEVQVRQAVNGQEAVAIWEEWRPHLIWMDIGMPHMDGLEATRHITAQCRDDDTCLSPVIIALTAHALEENREAILVEGCCDFVRKPFCEHDIFGMLRRHLDMRFVYETAAPTPETMENVSFEDLRAVVATLPVEWATDLYQACVSLDVDRILDLIRTVHAREPHLSDTLARWVHNFEYERLMALIAPQA
jgi:CheY-like chemotaxis protein